MLLAFLVTTKILVLCGTSEVRWVLCEVVHLAELGLYSQCHVWELGG